MSTTTIRQPKTFGVEKLGAIVRSGLISRNGNDIVLVTIYGVDETKIEPGKSIVLDPKVHETFSILTTNPDSLRIGISELKSAIPEHIDPDATDLDVMAQILGGELDGKLVRFRLELQSDGAINENTGQPYYNVRLSQGYKNLEKDKLKELLAKRLGLGSDGKANASKLEA